MSKISLILLAGGKGLRFSSKTPKQFIPLKGKPLVLHSYEFFLEREEVQEIIVVCPSEFRFLFSKSKPLFFADPGELRQDSVYNGLKQARNEFVLIHDGVRPQLNAQEIDQLLKEGFQVGAAALGSKTTSTVKRCASDGFVLETLKREELWEIHTPQMIQRELLLKAYEKKGERVFTDDLSLVEFLGYPAKIVEGSFKNMKVTYPEDLRMLEKEYASV